MTEQEFASIIGETKKTVLAAVQKHLPARFYHSIDDVVQETYLRAYRHLTAGKFRDEAAVSSWMYTIARNESLRMAKRLGREEEKMELLREETMVMDGMEGGPEVMQDIDLLSAMIEKLPVKYREVVMLRAQGASEEEVASRLGLRRGTVKSRFSRGREMLQKAAGEVR